MGSKQTIPAQSGWSAAEMLSPVLERRRAVAAPVVRALGWGPCCFNYRLVPDT